MIIEEANYNIYTPKNIADKMIEKIFNSYFSNGDKKEKLDNIKICDISCGSGNLLLPALEKLLLLSKSIYGEYRFYPSWIAGFDINDKALYIAKESIKNLLNKYHINYNENDINIRNCDALTLENKKYNIMIGNPPYLGEKNNKELFQKVKNTPFGQKYYEARMDYFYFFIEKAIELLEEDGFLIYLTTYYWLRADSGNILRTTLKENGNLNLKKIKEVLNRVAQKGNIEIYIANLDGETKLNFYIEELVNHREFEDLDKVLFIMD